MKLGVFDGLPINEPKIVQFWKVLRSYGPFIGKEWSNEFQES